MDVHFLIVMYIDRRGRSTVTAAPVVITIFAVLSAVPTFQNLTKQNKVQVITTGGAVGLAERIIDDTYVLLVLYLL